MGLSIDSESSPIFIYFLNSQNYCLNLFLISSNRYLLIYLN